MATTWKPADGVALGNAAQAGDHALVAALLSKVGADVDCRCIDTTREGGVDTRGWTALHLAAHEGDEGLAALLLQAGADPQATTVADWTPLQIAAHRGNAQVIERLLEHGADPNHSNRLSSALALAAARHHRDCVALLVGAGARDLQRALAGAALQWRKVGARRDERPDPGPVLRLLLDAGADPSLASEQGVTARLVALSCANREALDVLRGTPHAGTIFDAILDGDLESVRALVAEGVDFDAKDPSSRRTPLDAAIFVGDLAIVRLLVESGANIGATAGGSASSMAAALRREDLALAELLFELGASLKNIFSRLGTGGLPLVDWILSHHTLTAPEAGQLLRIALYGRRIDVAERALSLGADPNDGGMPLVYALEASFVEGVELLLSRGADPDLPALIVEGYADFGETPTARELAEEWLGGTSPRARTEPRRTTCQRILDAPRLPR